MDSQQDQPMSSFSIEVLNQRVADPDIFCGGGSVAALAASSAAALTRLVLDLAAPRRSNRDHRTSLLQASADAAAIEHQLYRAADEDVTVLDRLLDAQRELKQSSDRSRYHAALFEAARTPLEIAEGCLRLLKIIDAQMPRATRFTVSDLGAAATLARGAALAALLTSEVNLALLHDDPESAGPSVDKLWQQVRDVAQSVRSLADQIEARTLDAIHQQNSRNRE